MEKITFTMLFKVAIFAAIVLFIGGEIASSLPITAYRKDIGILVACVTCIMILAWLIAKSDKEEAVAPYIEELDGLREKLAERDENIAVLQDANVSFSEANEKLVNENKSMGIQITRLFEVENALRQEKQVLSDKFNDLYTDLYELDTKYKSLLEEHDATSDELTKTKEELVSTKARIGGLSKVVNDLKDKLGENALG